MKRSYEPDPRPAKRVRDSRAMARVHRQGCYCVLNCGKRGQAHHIYPRGQGGDDVAANLVCLCDVHHERYHASDYEARQLLGAYIAAERDDFVIYLVEKLGDSQGLEWLAIRLGM